MFLIEGDGKAILYTGDIRAETWWVNSLVQNPVLLPYALGFRRLDCMYLDTTFATKSTPYREFPSKAEGIKELLDKVGACSEDTIFYFHSWTFGYENVWVALATFLGSRIHLDDYRTRIYAALSTLDKKSLREAGLNAQSDNRFLRESGLEVREAPALCGFRNSNHIQPGCLTSHPGVRIHSCERGMGCPIVDHDTDARIVHIIPMINRVNGTEIAELGAGGGKGDLNQKEELETGDAVDVGKLMELCAKTIKDERVLSGVLALLQQVLIDGDDTIDLGADLQKDSQGSDEDLTLQSLVSVLSSHASKGDGQQELGNRTIRFPYSRHSSYYELCGLVDAFRPKDIYPCTVDDANWSPSLGMKYLFGAFCSADIFRHDAEMMQVYEAKLEQESNRKRDRDESQRETQSNEGNRTLSPIAIKRPRPDDGADPPTLEQDKEEHSTIAAPKSPSEVEPDVEISIASPPPVLVTPEPTKKVPRLPDARPSSLIAQKITTSVPPPSSALPTPIERSIIQTPSIMKERKRKVTDRQIAYEAALGVRLTWADYGGLVSTRSKIDLEEEEL